MNKYQYILLISQTSTPTTTLTPIPTSNPSSATSGLPTQPATTQVTLATGFDWIAFVAGLGIGAIFAALIKRRGDWLLKQKDAELAKERQQHEKEMRLLEADYQFFQRWREFLSQESKDLGEIWTEYNSSLKNRLSQEAVKRVEKAIDSQTRKYLNEIISNGKHFYLERKILRENLIKALSQEIVNLEMEWRNSLANQKGFQKN